MTGDNLATYLGEDGLQNGNRNRDDTANEESHSIGERDTTVMVYKRFETERKYHISVIFQR